MCEVALKLTWNIKKKPWRFSILFQGLCQLIIAYDYWVNNYFLQQYNCLLLDIDCQSW